MASQKIGNNNPKFTPFLMIKIMKTICIMPEAHLYNQIPSERSFTTKSSNQFKKSNRKAKKIGEDYYMLNIMK